MLHVRDRLGCAHDGGLKERVRSMETAGTEPERRFVADRLAALEPERS
jgi:hypothetical protein